MIFTLKINAMNDLHLPAKLLRLLNLGKKRTVQVQIKENTILIVPVDVGPRYTLKELDGLDKLHKSEIRKGCIPLASSQDIDLLI